MTYYNSLVRSSMEAAIGVGLLLTPWWSSLLAEVGLMASVVAQVTGAIIGTVGVITLVVKLVRSRR